MISLEEYQIRAREFCLQQCFNAEYLGLGLISEVGEVAGKLKKVIRDKDGILDDETRLSIIDECGDAAWYVANTCSFVGIKIEDDSIGRYDRDDLPTITVYMAGAAASVSNELGWSPGFPVSDLIASALIDTLEWIDNLLRRIDSTLEEAMERNIAKLTKRLETNTLHGSGDHREDLA